MVTLSEKFTAEFGKLKLYYAAAGFRMPFERFVALFFLISLAVFVVLLLLRLSLVVSIVAFLTFMSFAVSIPLTIRNNRIEAIESNLPDALKHMALVLKSGGTTEAALQEVAQADYGPVSEDLSQSLVQLQEGKSFEEVLDEAARKSGSLLFQRTVRIVLDAKRAGGGLADVMFSIAEDARDLLHIKRERRSRTTMHVLFLFVSGVLLAPFIFGFSVSIVHYINTGITSALPGTQSSGLCDLNGVLTLFLMAQTLIAVLAIGLIREGRFTKYLLYAPVLVLAALIIFEAGKFVSALIVGGSVIAC